MRNTFLISAAENYLEYLTHTNKGYEVIKIQNITQNIFGFTLILESKLKILDSLILKTHLGDFPLTQNDSEISISAYDEKNKILYLNIESTLKNDLFKHKESLELISDLKFLVQNVLHFFLQDLPLNLPTQPSIIQPNISALTQLKIAPNNEQILALEGIFKNPFCYIWGVAGSGKTKVVLLHALAFYLKANLKVAILAPTNNALEQCLGTLITSLQSIGFATHTILRLGTPTQGFAESFPQNCDTLLKDKAIDYKNSLKQAQIIAMTLDTFLRRNELHHIDFAHFFVDEAAFSPLIKILPLCAFHKPITLLGDHKQLQPICMLDNKDSKDTHWNLSNFWKYSALFLESFFTINLESFLQIHHNATPKITNLLTLVQTYRYGDNLAQLLNTYIYKNNLKGLNTQTKIYLIDTTKTRYKESEKLDKANEIEALECTKLAQDFITRNLEFAILTPFVNQRGLILKTMPSLYAKECVFTIHSSQGQEFDYVIFSPVILHYHLNNSYNQNALFALNVALSRAKKAIILVCDATYWKNQKGQFLSDLVMLAKPYLKP